MKNFLLSLKLFAKCVIAFLPVFVIWNFMRTHLLSFCDGEIPNYIWNHDFTNSPHEQNYDVVILGDSTGNSAVIPEVLSEKTLNLALGGQTIAEQYFVLKKYLEKNSAPKVCYVLFKDFHLQRTDCFYTRTLYSHVLDFHDELELIFRAKEFAEPTIAKKNCFTEWLSYRAFWFSKYLPAFLNASFNNRRAGNEHILNRMNFHRGTYIGRGVWEFNAVNTGVVNSFFVNPLFDEYYKKLLALCEQNGIAVRLVKLPTTGYIYTENYAAELFAYYEKLCSEFSCAAFDWLQGDFFPSDFTDAHHLNNRGSLKFSLLLKEKWPEAFYDFSNKLDFQKSGGEKNSSQTEAGLREYIAMENRADFVLQWCKAASFEATLFFRNGKTFFDDATLSSQFAAATSSDNAAVSIAAFEEGEQFYNEAERAFNQSRHVDLCLVVHKGGEVVAVKNFMLDCGSFRFLF